MSTAYLLKSHLFRVGRFEFSTRWEKFTMELILTKDKELAKLWQKQMLRWAYLTATHVSKISDDKSYDDYKVAEEVIAAFGHPESEEGSVEECQALLEATHVMIDRKLETDVAFEVKKDLEVIMMFAKSAIEAETLHERLESELEKLLGVAA